MERKGRAEEVEGPVQNPSAEVVGQAIQSPEGTAPALAFLCKTGSYTFTFCQRVPQILLWEVCQSYELASFQTSHECFLCTELSGIKISHGGAQAAPDLGLRNRGFGTLGSFSLPAPSPSSSAPLCSVGETPTVRQVEEGTESRNSSERVRVPAGAPTAAGSHWMAALGPLGALQQWPRLLSRKRPGCTQVVGVTSE